ncbi:hypothetical protein N8525_04335 [Verrucomicrobiales bacterium]|nr:hypothetical protein [Verrucomicrobiales bacterium]MDB4527047.1 hypothetical protein [bacterium]MDA7526373.1 hypothetical protein [Verrucomicrobiales bacterium]MDC0312726.1 hypothetical protein [Verrucomicrobiales bacterium]MDC0503317.1 hypothetical protein [Verrucomicrobiales bacterium]
MSSRLSVPHFASSLEVAYTGVVKHAVLNNWYDGKPDAAKQRIARQPIAKKK